FLLLLGTRTEMKGNLFERLDGQLGVEDLIIGQLEERRRVDEGSCQRFHRSAASVRITVSRRKQRAAGGPAGAGAPSRRDQPGGSPTLMLSERSQDAGGPNSP